MSLVLEFVSCVVKNLPEVPDEVMDGWVKNPKALQNVLRGVLCPPRADVEQARLLKRIRVVKVEAVKRFVCNDESLKSANVGWTSENFKTLFLNWVEEDVPEAQLAISELTRKSLDAPILTELGPRKETALAHFFQLLQKQSKGEEGTLLTNGKANIAYVIGSDGNFWAVRAYWGAGDRYWSVGVRSVEYPYGWDAGRQVISRDC